jgi:hypothetical protein
MAVVRPKLTEDEFMRLPDDGRKYGFVVGEAKEVPAGHEDDVMGALVLALRHRVADLFDVGLD